MKINISEIEVKDCWECPLFRKANLFNDEPACLADGVKLSWVENSRTVYSGKKSYQLGKWTLPCEIRPCPKERK
jgi:hypothetical protein